MKLNNQESRDMLIYAFRYALGRMTFASLTMSQIIIKNWQDISKGHQKLIQKEIKTAIDDNLGGMEIDVNEWRNVLKKEVKK